jgi:hypothetical protein
MRPKPDHGEESYRGSGKLAGKKAVITGADSGIGRAVAIAYAREGADVLIAYLDEHDVATYEPRDSGKSASHADPLPARFAAAGPVPVEHSEAENDYNNQQRPPCKSQQQVRGVMQAEIVERNRKNNDSPESEQQDPDAGKCKSKRNEIQFDEAAFLLLLVDHVQGVHNCFHPGVCTP